MSIGPFTFNGFDVVVLLILLISLIIAVQRGLVRELLSVIALIVAGVIAIYMNGQYMTQAKEFISPDFLAEYTLRLGSFILSYLLVVFVLSKLFKKSDSKSISFINRTTGAAFGVFRGLLIAALITMFFNSSYKANVQAQETKKILVEKGLFDEMIKTYPKSFQDQMNAEPKDLPDIFANSAFYPLLDKIGAMIQNLPFAKMKSYAQMIDDGDIDGISREILE